MVVHPLESARHRTRSLRGALPSIAVHAAIVLVAVHATAHAAPPHERPTTPRIVDYVPNPPARVEPRPTSTVRSTGAPSIRSPLNTMTVMTPSVIPDHIPAIDPSRGALVIRNGEFGHGVAPTPPIGSGVGNIGSDALSATDVERQVSPIGAPPTPTYPEALRSSGVRGSVTAEFVVDTTGRVEPDSFRALASDNDLFSAAVRAAVLRTRFHSAEAGGRRVRQRVQESFSFILQ